MIPVLEAVPNVSEGRDPGVHRALVEAVEGSGAELLDWSADPDHHRCVLTLVGTPAQVEAASLAVARVALDSIDLRRHRGVHPRIGALDVLPFVPLHGLALEDAVRVARRVADGLAAMGIPAYLYAAASTPPGRKLSTLRRGGFEALVEEFPGDRVPDRLPRGWSHPGVHPTAGATCVGARGVLLAWNIRVERVPEDRLRRLAAELRESGGGFEGLRTLVFRVAGGLQLSMNLEDPGRVSPFAVYCAVEARVAREGGRLGDTEVIGMIPEALVHPSAADRLRLRGTPAGRVLEARVGQHMAARVERELEALLDAVREAGTGVPEAVRAAVARLEGMLRG